ncbi:MAG: LL-diaminopimelate aminotransferase, partial [Nitrospirota bacterium]|nr:LL-diaminopimelate aminotransferase [Nitrospirota bacterium]
MAGFPIEYASRIKALPPYLFATIDEMKQRAIARGVDIINLGVGDPDLPTPAPIIERLKLAAAEPRHHQYPSYDGQLSFRQAVANWYKRRFRVTLDAGSQVLTLIGSKEGIGHVPLAFVNPGDIVLVPSPGYPVYPVGASFAGGIPRVMPLLKKNGFLPDLQAIPKDVAKRAKLMFLNSPNNPTAAVAGKDFFQRVVSFASEHQIIVCHDAAYSEIYYDGRRPPSFLEVEGAGDVGVEFHSLSKTFNMTGWRIGFAVGNKDVLAGLGKIKSNLDSGVFQVVQEAGILALESDDQLTDAIRKVYQERRDSLVPGLQSLGLEME